MALNGANAACAIFLDTDGTLVHEVPLNASPERISLIPGVGPALRKLQDAGCLLIVASNQPGIALGLFSSNALTAVEARLDELLAPYGVIVTAYRWCPHVPAGVRVSPNLPACTCRKPRPGLLLDAAATHDVALDRSWMIGDMLDDVEAGVRAGCRTILVDRGGETRWRGGRNRTPNAIVYDFADAVSIILDGADAKYAGQPRAAPG